MEKKMEKFFFDNNDNKQNKDYTVLCSETPFLAKEDLLAKLIEIVSTYLKEEDIEKIKKAYEMAEFYHREQKRKSGEEYIVHPISVSIILANLHMDAKTIIAGLLHDCVEDTKCTLDDIEKEFDKEIAYLVDGVTKLTKLNLDTDKVELQAENLRKMFLSMARDVRVIIIKLADRLHNLRTLEYQTPSKQQEKAKESIEIYAPIANRLGISQIKTNMDDLCLKYLYPREFKSLVEMIEKRREARESFIDKIIVDLKNYMNEAGIKVEVYGRVKNLFSIFKKMHNKNKTIDQIYDLFAVRILVDNIKDCYAVLGIIHEYYKPIPGRFKDYIAMPKENNYQSLHTTVIGSEGIPFEIQIRTYEMHKVAEYGIAAHWAYKENGNSTNANMAEVSKMNWMKNILEFTKDTDSSNEFLGLVKNDLDMLSEKVYALTPQGDVISLTKGSCPIDFAYAIHSAVGNKMIGAKVNSVLVPIDYEIQNGDVISIITSGNSNGPSRDWLNICKTSGAKSKINHWFKTERRDENISRGKDLVDAYIKQKNYKKEDLFKQEYIDVALKKFTSNDIDDIYASIGHGGLKESQFIGKLYELYVKDNEKELTDEDIQKNIQDSTEQKNKNEKNKKKSSNVTKTESNVEIKGVDGLEVRFAKCCSPMPGDEIVGFITRGRGITIHRSDCPSLLSLPDIERERLIEASWAYNETTSQKYNVNLIIYATNKRGQLVDISRIFTEANIDIVSLESRTGKNGRTTINVGFSISSKEELAKIREKLLSVEGVLDIERG